MTIRSLLAGTAGVALLAGAAAAQEQSASQDLADGLTIVSWGGAYSGSQREAYYKPYTEKTGVQILEEDKSANALAGVRAQVEAGNVTWDVVDMLESDAIRACDEGLLMEIPHDEWLAPAPDGAPPTEDFVEGTLRDCFIPQILYATMFAYNTEAFPEGGPQSVEDIWDVEAYPGTRALQRIPQKNLEWALLADGVEPDQVYDVLATQEGQDRAFAKLDELKPHAIWWSEGAQPPQMLADGEAAIATAFNGRIFNAQVAEDQPFEIMWDHQMFEIDGWTVPVGNEDDLETIKDFLHFATDTQRLADQANWIAYAPARYSSVPLVGHSTEFDVDMAPHMPTFPDNFTTAFQFDPMFWADYGDSLEARFESWVAN